MWVRTHSPFDFQVLLDWPSPVPGTQRQLRTRLLTESTKSSPFMVLSEGPKALGEPLSAPQMHGLPFGHITSILRRLMLVRTLGVQTAGGRGAAGDVSAMTLNGHRQAEEPERISS